MKGLILAGGSGTRLRPLTHTGPKQLIPIANKPIILYCLEDLKAAGIKDIGVILGYNMPEKVRELLGDGTKFGVKITYIFQGEPRGIAHAIGCAEEFVGREPFAVYLGDNVLKGGIKKMVDEFAQGNHDALIALCSVKNPEQFGVAEIDEKGNIISLVEKPQKPKSNLALIGIYFFKNRIFDMIRKLKPSWRNELEITDALVHLLKEGCSVKTHIVKGWWKDTGKPEDIIEANRLILEDLKASVRGSVHPNTTIEGCVAIGEDTKVLERSAIRGPAIIGKNCQIGPSTHIGPYTAIGDNCTIVGCAIENSIVMLGTKINCNEKIVGSLIGAYTTIESSTALAPAGKRLVVGDHSKLMI